MLVNLQGFAPDADPTTPGAVLECDQMLPSTKGMKAAPSNLATSFAALAEAATGAAMLVKLDGTTRLFVGSNAKINEGASGSWTNVSRGLGYTAGSNRWRFAQFGNDSVAANKTVPLQRSSGAAFADLTAPKASLVETLAGFVILADCNDSGTGLATGFGDQPNRWWCSGIYDVATWTPSLASQCASGLLVDAPGPIRALRRLGASVVAYKDAAIFVGTYVGPTAGVWRFDLVPGDIGCSSQEAVVSTGASHLFPGEDDFYSFDGARPQTIGAPVREWFFSRLNKKYKDKIRGLHDRTSGLVWWFYPSTNSTDGSLDSAIVYDYRANRWGSADRSIEATVEIVLDGITYDNLGSSYATYDDLPAIPADSPFWTAGAPTLAVISTDHKPYILGGVPGSWSFTTSRLGGDDSVSLVKRITPRWISRPSVSALTPMWSMGSGESMSSGTSVPLSSGRFDTLRAARWHQFRVSGSGSAELAGLDVSAQPDGDE